MYMNHVKIKLSNRYNPKSFMCDREAIRKRRDGAIGIVKQPLHDSDPSVVWVQHNTGEMVPYHISELEPLKEIQ